MDVLRYLQAHIKHTIGYLKAIAGLQMAPPVPGHPSVKLSDLHRATGQHDEACLTSRGPVIEI